MRPSEFGLNKHITFIVPTSTRGQRSVDVKIVRERND